MAKNDPGPCPVCKTNSMLAEYPCLPPENSRYYYHVECPRCGKYDILSKAKDLIETASRIERDEYPGSEFPTSYNSDRDFYIAFARKGLDRSPSIISHTIRTRPSKDIISQTGLLNILINNSAPTPAELANNLIIFLGNILSSPGDTFRVPQHNAVYKDNICGALGFKINNEITDLHFIVTSLEKQNLLNIEYVDNGRRTARGRTIPELISLTLPGWRTYEELKRSVKDSRKAFMAMDFIDPDNKEKDYFFQDHLFPEYLIPAVKETDYELSNPLASEPKAGNIHARLEVEIRASRFVVAELSHHNSGAYWEAGFARGLGKPVIYMFNKEIGGWDRPHFDVGSDQIVFWKKEEPEEAAKALKGVIRATLFGEAKMED